MSVKVNWRHTGREEYPLLTVLIMTGSMLIIFTIFITVAAELKLPSD